MKKSFRFLVLALVITLVMIGHNYLSPMLGIITGYTAKNMCSCVFVAGRTPESAIEGDLNFSFIKYAKSTIDREKKAVYSTIFGLAKRKAIYREGFGCTLILDDSEESLRQQKLNMPEMPHDYDELVWPSGNKIVDTVFSEVDYNKLNSAVSKAFDNPVSLREKNTRSVLVVYKGHIVAEKYAEGFDRNTLQLGWSMTKSITNAMIGILVREGKLDVNDPPGLAEWNTDNRGKIKIHDLMQMNSGLEWNEEYGNKSDATVMLYLESDLSGYVINKPGINEPGTNWLYSSGTSNILQAIIRNTINDQDKYLQFPYEELFSKIGMYHTIMEPDATGTFVGSSYTWATSRDWARFGLLYLNDGMWEGERILPENWVSYSLEESPTSNGIYGAQIWLNLSGDMADVPNDMFCFRGFQGQRVYVIPSQSLVVVRLGISEKGTFDLNQFLAGILGTFPD